MLLGRKTTNKQRPFLGCLTPLQHATSLSGAGRRHGNMQSLCQGQGDATATRKVSVRGRATPRQHAKSLSGAGRRHGNTQSLCQGQGDATATRKVSVRGRATPRQHAKSLSGAGRRHGNMQSLCQGQGDATATCKVSVRGRATPRQHTTSLSGAGRRHDNMQSLCQGQGDATATCKVFIRGRAARAATLRQKEQTIPAVQRWSRYTDTRPTCPSPDPIPTGAWQGSHYSTSVLTLLRSLRPIPPLSPPVCLCLCVCVSPSPSLSPPPSLAPSPPPSLSISLSLFLGEKVNAKGLSHRFDSTGESEERSPDLPLSSRTPCHWAPHTTDRFVCLLVGCLTSQQQASVSQGRICSDNFTCCHTEIEVADPTFYLTQSQYTDTGPTSPSADPTTPGA